MTATEVKASRPFQYIEGPMGVPQVCGFWDPNTAVLFGYSTEEFRLAQVGLAAVLTEHPAFGPALSAHDVPGQYDADLGPYGEPTGARFIAFCPISETKAVLVTAIVFSSADNTFNVVGDKAEVSYTLMTRASATSYDFAFHDPSVAGTAWSWPAGAVDFGDGSAADFGCQVLQTVVGTEAAPIGMTVSMTVPGPSRTVQYMGPITISGMGSAVSYTPTTGIDDPGAWGRATADTGQAAVNDVAGAFALYGAPATGSGILNRAVVGGLLHADLDHVHSPQIAGTYTTGATGIDNGSGAKICWAELLGGNSVSFHSVSIDDPPVRQYGAPVALPAGVVSGVVAVGITPGCNNLAFVPVTLTVSDAVRDDTTWEYSGTVSIYGGVMDFRAGALLRSDWTLLGSWDYHDLPSRPLLVVEAVGDHEIDLAWAPVTGGAPIGGIVYDLYRNGSVIAAGINLTSFADTGRDQSTTYEYVLVAYDNAGNYSPYSERLVVTTTGPDSVPDTTPPTAPGFSVVSHSSHSVTFRVEGSTDDTAVSFYRIFMTGHYVDGVLVDDSGSVDIPLSVDAHGDGTYTVDWRTTDTGASDHQPYFALDDQQHFYCARAYDLAGNQSARSAYEASGKIMLSSVVHPSETGAPNVTGTTGTPKTGITFTWGEPTNSDGSGTTGVVTDIYRSGVKIATVGAATTTYTDSFAAHSRPTYQLQSRNAGGWTSLMSASAPNWDTLGE